MEPFWILVRETNLRQGDLLPGCWIPEYPADFAEQTDEARIIEADQADLIVITQTCDLEHANVSLIALCPVWSITDFEEGQTTQGRGKSGKSWRDFWNNVRKGRSPTLHLLASPTTPAVARAPCLSTFGPSTAVPSDTCPATLADSATAGVCDHRSLSTSPKLSHGPSCESVFRRPCRSSNRTQTCPINRPDFERH